MNVHSPNDVFDPYKRLEAHGLKLTIRKVPADWFNAALRSGDVLYTSGQIAITDDGPLYPGRMRQDLTVETGRESVTLRPVAGASKHG